jgi:hypothetical protein
MTFLIFAIGSPHSYNLDVIGPYPYPPPFLLDAIKEQDFEARLQAAVGSMLEAVETCSASVDEMDLAVANMRDIESELLENNRFTTRLVQAVLQPVLSGVAGLHTSARKRQRMAGDMDIEKELREEHHRELLLIQAITRCQAPPM